MRIFVRQLFIGLWAALLAAAPVRAQGQCGTVTGISLPVDTATFAIAQEFGVPSPRHQGRYHTGEDYYGGRNASYLQPVRAVADGRVTYSAPWGWGRDGGVVIIEHTFPDGSTAYSQYGHMEEIPERPFPARYTCVKAGDIIGSVGNARPAPHLHFEIRTNQPDIPGPGYTWDFPTALGWKHPTPFVVNWGAWLHPAHRWHLELNGELRLPPVELADHSLVYLEANRLRRITPDGRILWRANLDKTAVGLFGYGEAAAAAYADGAMQAFALDGTPRESWTTGIPLESQLLTGERLVFRSADGALVAFGADRETVIWRLEDVPPVASAYAAPNLLAFLTADHQLLSVSPQGQLLDTATLAEPGSFAAAPDGTLLVYVAGGLWRVDGAGVWALEREDAPPGGAGSGVLLAEDGQLYLFSREAAPALRAYDRNGQMRWQTDLPDVSGTVRLQQHGGALLLLGGGGDVLALNPANGAICNQLRVYPGANVWYSLGADGTLRAAVGAQILALDWAAFAGRCG
ncbi:MAG: hypothetical protein BroJett038_22050 [Chloroflexota bacterium]|nr:MAG: hypothetical protein BroJett038_22050 [Chloroflexota bacterium]